MYKCSWFYFTSCLIQLGNIFIQMKPWSSFFSWSLTFRAKLFMRLKMCLFRSLNRRSIRFGPGSKLATLGLSFQQNSRNCKQSGRICLCLIFLIISKPSCTYVNKIKYALMWLCEFLAIKWFYANSPKCLFETLGFIKRVGSGFFY